MLVLPHTIPVSFIFVAPPIFLIFIFPTSTIQSPLSIPQPPPFCPQPELIYILNRPSDPSTPAFNPHPSNPCNPQPPYPTHNLLIQPTTSIIQSMSSFIQPTTSLSNPQSQLSNLCP